MNLQFKSGLPAKSKNVSDAAVFLYEDDGADLKNRADLALFQEIIGPLVKSGQFKAKFLAQLPVKTGQGWLHLIGLGPAAKLRPAKIVESAAASVKMALARQTRELEMILPPTAKVAADEALELAAIGSRLALYQQTEFKSETEPKQTLTTVRLWAEGLTNGAEIVERGRVAAEAVCLARRLGDLPGNVLYPESFAAEAASLGKRLKLKVKILDEKALAKEKMNLITAVGQGSARPPRLVTVSYQGGKAGDKPVVLVGKGVTFDSGGLSLKPSGSLEGMKTDMAGAATVLAAVAGAAEMNLPLNITAVLALAENMPDGAATRVGDVFTSRSGQTVEVTNTDAEGRLVLADALTWAGEMKPAAVIDVATLTGACVVALGERCAGLFTDDEGLKEGLLSAAGAAGENVWQLPLLDDYEEMLKSETADMINAPLVPKGGSINAALFLRRFAPKNAPWAHVDIAGPGRAGKARPGTTVGASGFGVRTLLRFLSDYHQAEVK